MKRARDLAGVCGVESVDMTNVLMFLSQSGAESTDLVQYYPAHEERIFECKTCYRQFSSFQALGGHRASHKKPNLGSGDTGPTFGLAKPKVHECSICGLEFAVGQALGGHMRRHRPVNEALQLEGIDSAVKNIKRDILLDLNFPPLPEGLGCKKDDEIITLTFL